MNRANTYRCRTPPRVHHLHTLPSHSPPTAAKVLAVTIMEAYLPRTTHHKDSTAVLHNKATTVALLKVAMASQATDISNNRCTTGLKAEDISKAAHPVAVVALRAG